MTEAARFHVQGPTRWRALQSEHGEAAVRFLDLCHEQHIPMLPALAARLMAEDGRLIAQVRDVVRGAVGQPKVRRRSRGCRFEVLFDFVLAPILRRAAQDIGAAVLLGDAPVQALPKAAAEDTMRRIEARFVQLLSEPALMGRPFWNLAGFAVMGDGFAQANRWPRSGTGWAGRLTLAQEPDAALANLLADVEPEFHHRANRALKTTLSKKASWRRSGIKPKEGGIDGIRLSRSLDELSDAMPSELCLPREVTLVKLAEDGFLVKHRPPFRQPKRDLLMMVMVPDEVDSAALQLAIAAFADATIRLWALLSRQVTNRVDLAFVRNRLGYPRAASCRLDHLPDCQVRDPFNIPANPRLGLILNCNLMPDMIDQLPSDLPATWAEAEVQPDLYLREAMKAVSSVPDLSGNKGQAKSTGPLALEHYTSVATVCMAVGDNVPFGLGQRADINPATGILHRLHLPAEIAGKAALLSCPETGAIENGFVWDAGDSDPRKIQWPQDEDNAVGIALAGLSLSMVDFALEALSHG